ncbi:MAG: PilX N-terminal domain-containing pilus assembly protein [Nitrococcus sp.]|nr:PilX N-terminal domain-containing pilus assembly protein [Nitrococcus sp.]
MGGAQNGSVLVVSLLFLLVMTLIGITAMQGVSLEEKMAGNARGGTLALQAAEAALREGEEWVMDDIDLYDPPPAVSSCSSNPCDLWEVNKPESYPQNKDMSWWDGNAREYGTGTQEYAALAADPHFLVEYLSYDPSGDIVDANDRAHRIGPHFYRATAAGFGPQGSTQRVLQSTVRTWKN